MSDEPNEEELIELALQGLREATERHKQAGRPIVFVRDDLLIESVNGVETILKKVAPMIKVQKKHFIKRPQTETLTNE